MPYAPLADLVLALHVGVVLFVVGGLAAVVVGNLRGWRWVNDLRLRLAHLAAIAFVVAEAWFGLTCPLTTLEMALRRRAGGVSYAGGFVEHWLQRLLYFDAPAWAFVVAYSVFGVLVVAAWWVFPPHAAWRRRPP
jgi:hypothetical protein